MTELKITFEEFCKLTHADSLGDFEACKDCPLNDNKTRYVFECKNKFEKIGVNNEIFKPKTRD